VNHIRFLQKSIMPLTVGLLAGSLILIDHFLASLFAAEANFVWVAFVSWTVFFGSPTVDRFKAVLSFVVGFLAANLIVLIGAHLELVWILPAIAATVLVNFLVLWLADVKFLVIPGIFVGIAMTFARGGVGLEMWSWPTLGLVVAYGVLGLIVGYVCMQVSSATKKSKKRKSS
jgi:hypothetical protein